MASSMEWMIPHRVLLLRITGDVSSDEVRQIAGSVEKWIDNGHAPVHLMIDTTQMGRFPVSVTQIHGYSRWLYHPKTGYVVLLNPIQLIAFLTTIITGMAHVQFKIAETEQEALQILYKVDDTLLQNP